jgi:RNA polymerase sigma-70 factor (ECF subfamily)
MTTTLVDPGRCAQSPGAKGFAAWVASWFNQPARRTMADDEPIPTRASLLQRLKDPADQAGWDEFFRTYRGLIHGVARRAGLSETEAKEVVQETFIAIARKMPEFRYDPAKDSFKGWLLQITRWRIADQFRKRPVAGLEPPSTVSGTGPRPATSAEAYEPARGLSGGGEAGTRRTATVDRIPDPAGSALTAIWDEEWEKHLLSTALARIKRRVNPAHYEIYHLHVILGRPVSEVKRALGVNVGQIYLAKHCVGRLLRREVSKLELSAR